MKAEKETKFCTKVA